MPRTQLQFISMNYLPVRTAGPFPAENRCVYVVVLSLRNTTSTQSDPLFSHTDQQRRRRRRRRASDVTPKDAKALMEAWSSGREKKRKNPKKQPIEATERVTTM